MAIRDRDVLWCRALIHELDTTEIARVTKYFNNIRPDAAREVNEPDRPRIVCLCGSTRFTEQMLIKQWELTKQGHIVLSWCALPESYFSGSDKFHIGDQEGVKKIVDEVHKRKIDLADEIFVINIGGYIGNSTRSEIEYAHSKGKFIRYMEEDSHE